MNTTFLLCCFLGSAYFCWAPPQGTALSFIPADISDMVFTPARALASAIGFQPSMRSIIQSVAVLHCFESVYAGYLCRHHVQGPFVTVSTPRVGKISLVPLISLCCDRSHISLLHLSLASPSGSISRREFKRSASRVS